MVLTEETLNETTSNSPLNETSDDAQESQAANTVYPVLQEEENEEMTEAKRAFSRSRSPMQEVVLLEHRWQGFIHKLDEILSSHGDANFSQSAFCAIFRQENTLSICFKLFDWENTGGVPQDKFVDSIRFSVRGAGSQDWIDLVDVLAFVVCGDKNNIKESDFHRIFKSKGVVEKLYKLISKDCDGCVRKSVIMDLIANLTYARPRERFTKENLEHLERMFRDTLGSKQELSFDDFKKIVHSRNSFFADRVFQVFDRDKSGSVSLCEFLDAMHQFTGKSPNEKLQFLFRVYDVDGDGLVQREELGKVMKACMEENGMTFSNEQIDDLTIALFEDADTENRGEITFEDLKAQIEKHPGLLENLSISIDRWLLPPNTEANKEEVKKFKIPYQLTVPYFKNNYIYLLFLLFFISVNVGLFIDRAMTIAATGANIYYILARACGQCLNFNSALIVVLVLRHSLTFLRSHGATAFLPLDQSLYFHKMCGYMILFHSLLHTFMHLINFSTIIVYDETINKENFTAIEWLLTAKPKLFGLVPGWANPTGVILIIILIIMVICSLPFVRKSGSFQVFYWTHLLYVLYFLLTILHGPKFWKWFIVPGLIFLFEKIYRALQISSGHRKTYISSGILLPSKVIHLVVQKPPGFHFHPGDYVFVNVPKIAKYEWHPFTISSAPEQEDAVWLHVRAVGQWTNRLFEYFQKQQQLCESTHMHDLTTIIKEDTKIIMESVKNNASEVQDSNKGLVNVSFEPDASDSKQEETEHDESSEDTDGGDTINEMAPSRPIRLKRNVAKTTSVPDFEKKMRKREKNLMIRNYYRTNSDNSIDPAKLRDARRITNGIGSAMLFPTNRSVAQSVRYMRKKPKVVTLDLPEDASGTEDEAPNIEEYVSQDPAINLEKGDLSHSPKPPVVRLTSGRIFRRKKSKNINQESRRTIRQSRIKEAEAMGQCTIGAPLVIYLDGAYGAPSSHIFRAQHAVLIGTGIGVTPFASILQSIMHRYLKTRQTCPKCSHIWNSDMSQAVMNLRKVDFFWINRNQRSFEWFVNLLSQLEIEQAEQGGVLERFLDMHMYITSALQKTDMKAVGLQLAMDLLHEKEKRDLITGLKTRTNAGRPNWDKVFKQLRNHKKGKITVFYCGPLALGRTLRYKCAEFGFEFRKEVF